jgi:hypothetical protein
MTRVLGGLGEQVQEHPARRPACARLEPRCLGQWLGDLQVRQGHDQRRGPVRDLLVLIQAVVARGRCRRT